MTMRIRISFADDGELVNAKDQLISLCPDPGRRSSEKGICK